MKKIEPPKILVDLYRDLRDRRLLLPFGLLAGALVLVPLALSKSSHPSPPPAVASSAGKVSAAQPAVLTAEVGVRNYNKRLAAMKEKDPFKRHFKLPNLPGGNPRQARAAAADRHNDDPGTAAGYLARNPGPSHDADDVQCLLDHDPDGDGALASAAAACLPRCGRPQDR